MTGLHGVCIDDRPLDSRSDVLSWVTSPLVAPLELIGAIEVALWVGTTAFDTDFTAKLIDVLPETGLAACPAINITDSIQRCRYRNGYDTATPMPGPVMMAPAAEGGYAVPLVFELYPTAVVIQPGHCIRLDISSSNFPRFDVNDNSGAGLLGASGKPVVARQRIWHSLKWPSSIRVQTPTAVALAVCAAGDSSRNPPARL